MVLSEKGKLIYDGNLEEFLTDRNRLIEANLIHIHKHRHKSLEHSHYHTHQSFD
ncbi:MAG: hypothetical protein Q9M89_07960 [Persephonella sp.]|nr:hypothetical protein [Persephonella sp.]